MGRIRMVLKNRLPVGGLSLLLLSSGVSANGDRNDGQQFLSSFIAGDYALIGRAPDSNIAYTGSAHIENRGGTPILTRRIGNRTVTASGALEVPRPPGEGNVVRFRWVDESPMVMSCLVSGDLDNYARLTCYLDIDGREHRQPGIEALFPTATWPQAPKVPKRD